MGGQFDYATDAAAYMQDVFNVPWIPSFDIDYFLGVDGISFPLVMLTALVSLLAMAASWSVTKHVKGYCILFLLLETGMLGVFLALDFFLFYVFWEVMLLPMYFLIGVWGGPRREYAAIKFFLYTLVGSVLMLIAILMLYFRSDLRTLAERDLAKPDSAGARRRGSLGAVAPGRPMRSADRPAVTGSRFGERKTARAGGVPAGASRGATSRWRCVSQVGSGRPRRPMTRPASTVTVTLAARQNHGRRRGGGGARPQPRPGGVVQAALADGSDGTRHASRPATDDFDAGRRSIPDTAGPHVQHPGPAAMGQHTELFDAADAGRRVACSGGRSCCC